MFEARQATSSSVRIHSQRLMYDAHRRNCYSAGKFEYLMKFGSGHQRMLYRWLGDNTIFICLLHIMCTCCVAHIRCKAITYATSVGNDLSSWLGMCLQQDRYTSDACSQLRPVGTLLCLLWQRRDVPSAWSLGLRSCLLSQELKACIRKRQTTNINLLQTQEMPYINWKGKTSAVFLDWGLGMRYWTCIEIGLTPKRHPTADTVTTHMRQLSTTYYIVGAS